MVKESSAKMMYTSRLPAPNMYGVTAGTSNSPGYKTNKMTRSDNRMPREEQVQEIIELKKALAKTRQDLQKTRSRRQSQDNRSSSDEETYHRRDDMGGSMSGSLSGMSAVSNKPCLNRELVAKLRSMTETIKMLSTENVALREENDQLLNVRDDMLPVATTSSTVNDRSGGEISKLKAVIESYEKQVNELGDKVKTLEQEIESKEKQTPQPPPEKDKYKSLAKRLKEERNQLKEQVEEKKKEQDELKVEIEKMTEIIGDLRENCGKLQEELQVRLDSPRRVSEKAIQTAPLTRRASIGGGEMSPRAKITPKRTRSTVSSNPSHQVSSPSSRQSQVTKAIELSRPKIRNTSHTGSVPNSPARGPRIVKPVQRTQTSSSIPKCSPSPSPSPRPSPSRARSSSASAASAPSKIPSLSKIPTPSKSRIPVKPSYHSKPVVQDYQDNDEVLYISEEGLATSDDHMDVSDTQSPSPSRMTTRRNSREHRDSSQSMEVESVQDDVNGEDFPPPPIPEETPTLDQEFPAPPAPADLEKLSMEAEMQEEREPVTEDPMITTPRTLRRADSMRQRMAARRIQRTWKHFYQELEEKKSDGSSSSGLVPQTQDNVQTQQNNPKLQQERVGNISTGDTDSLRMVQEEVEGDEAIAGVQAAVISHGARVATLAAARARGGIYTARPWVAKDSETESENEDIIENLQGLIRSHSFRLKTLREEEDVFRVGKVSSIRAKFSRRSPDGASDDYLESDRNV